MRISELRIAGDFEIPDVTVGDDVDLALRVRIYAVERDLVDVSGYGTGPETLEGGLRVQAVALNDEGGSGERVPSDEEGWPVPAEPPPTIPPDYADSAE